MAIFIWVALAYIVWSVALGVAGALATSGESTGRAHLKLALWLAVRWPLFFYAGLLVMRRRALEDSRNG